MRGIILVLLICLVDPQPAMAGAWLREKGRGFLAVSSMVRGVSPVRDYEADIYMDYGAHEDLTIGLSLNDKPGISGHILAFARLPLMQLDEETQLAVELGVGGHQVFGTWNPMYRLALSYGFGFSGWAGPGWLAVDSAVEHRTRLGKPVLKLDAAIGSSSANKVRPLLQLETAMAQNTRFQWAVTPSLMISGLGDATLVIGVQRRSYGRHRTGLKIALWRNF